MKNSKTTTVRQPVNLAEELGKGLPFDLPERETFLNLLRTADCFNREAENLFSKHGISRPQFNIIYTLCKAGPDGMPIRKLAQHMVTACPDVTRLVDRLETAGLVSRNRIGDDRRVIHVGVTAEGLSLFKRLEDTVNAMLRRWFCKLKPSELDHLNTTLFELRHPHGSEHR
jgi:DNA-binding MarR family transcriptional regulator